MPKLVRVKNSPYWYAEGTNWDGVPYRRSTKEADSTRAQIIADRIGLEESIPTAASYPLCYAANELVNYKINSRRSEAEIEIVTAKLSRVMEHFGPGFDVNTLTAQAIDNYVLARRRHVSTAGPISDSTIRKELGKLFEALRLATRNGLFVGKIETLKTKLLAPDQPRTRHLTEEEYVSIMSEIPVGRRDYVLIWCHTGARFSELYRIEAKHISVENPARPKVFLLGTKGKGEFRERWAPLSPEALAILQDRARRYPEGPLFPKKWLRSNVRQTLCRACDRLKIAHCSANDLRRTFATWYGRTGKREDLKKVMGHSPNSKLVDHVYRQLHDEAGHAQVALFPKQPEIKRMPGMWRRKIAERPN